MKQNAAIRIETVTNGFLVLNSARMYSDEPLTTGALVFETKAGLLRYIDEHFSATKKPTVETK